VEYRTLGRTGARISAISLGTEYIQDANQERMSAVIDAALERGANYLDAWYAEPTFRDRLGVALRDRRGNILISGHLGATHQDGQYVRTRDPDLAEKFVLDYLERLQTDHVDVLFLHNCDESEDLDAILAPGGLADRALAMQRAGRTRWIGFSGHTPATAQRAVETGIVDVLMFPLNLTGHAAPGKAELLAACSRTNAGLVAMKPFAGGMLFQPEPTLQANRFVSGGREATLHRREPVAAATCLAYVLAHDEVSTVVPGCATVEEVAEDLGLWDAPAQERDFSQVLASFATYEPGHCVYCNHCLPCPAGIDIAAVNRLLDRALVHGMDDALEERYRSLQPNADDCLACGDCEERCPFGVAAVERMDRARELFAQATPAR